MFNWRFLVLLCPLLVIGSQAAGDPRVHDAPGEPVKVPHGNRLETAPEVPGATIKRLFSTRSTVDRKYRKVIQQLSRNKKLVGEIRRVAALYDIDPIHMIAALVGEHSFNVDAFDSMQVYYIKAASYLELDTSFEYDGEPVSEFVRRPQFTGCAAKQGSYALWDCRERIWNMIFAGRTVDGIRYDSQQFDDIFFRPFYAGQTFGLGQISPLAALKANDMVVRLGGLRRLSADRPGEVYFTIMDPRQSLHYMAAIIRHAIDSYRDIAGMDISANPGVTATLYNLGGAEHRARILNHDNALNRIAGRPIRLPTENYYGWLVNDRIGELEALLGEREQAGSGD
jgi:hypothetical protein